jgi:hypothetical protein
MLPSIYFIDCLPILHDTAARHSPSDFSSVASLKCYRTTRSAFCCLIPHASYGPVPKHATTTSYFFWFWRHFTFSPLVMLLACERHIIGFTISYCHARRSFSLQMLIFRFYCSYTRLALRADIYLNSLQFHLPLPTPQIPPQSQRFTIASISATHGQHTIRAFEPHFSGSSHSHWDTRTIWLIFH